MTHNMHLRGDAQTVITQALAEFGESAQFPGLPPRQPIRFDMDDSDRATTHRMLAMLTHTLLVPSGPNKVLIIPDTPQNEKQYLVEDSETIHLPSLTKDASKRRSEVESILTTVFSIPHVSFQSDGVTITSDPETLQQVNDVLRNLYTHDSQVQLHIQCYLTSHNRDLDAGLTPPASTTVFNVLTEADSLVSNNESVIEAAIEDGLISSSASELELAILLVEYGYASGTPLGSSFEVFGNGITTTGVEPDSITLNNSLTNSTVTELQDATLHLLNEETGKLHIGEKYPVVTETYSSTSTSLTTSLSTSTSTLAQPAIEYEDLGLVLEATPIIHASGSIDLSLKLALRSLSGNSANGNPIIDDQEFSSALTVRAGMSTMMVSNLTHSDTGTNTGLPGLDTTNRSTSGQDEQLVVVITPEVTRSARPHIEADTEIKPAGQGAS
ncbi:hypothetical protein GCM10011586_30740 [Silvibacterium dinghuense]|nr:hypothetical protein GCM10011586_30740 [Silvibacterium dinghuense]